MLETSTGHTYRNSQNNAPTGARRSFAVSGGLLNKQYLSNPAPYTRNPETTMVLIRFAKKKKKKSKKKVLLYSCYLYAN